MRLNDVAFPSSNISEKTAAHAWHFGEGKSSQKVPSFKELSKIPTNLSKGLSYLAKLDKRQSKNVVTSGPKFSNVK